MSEPKLIENEMNNPESSSRERIIEQELNKDKTKEKEKDKNNIENNKEQLDKFIIESSYLKLQECTAMTLGQIKIYQKCFICPICDPKKSNYICKFCYNKCHQKCRDFTKIPKKEEDYKGKKNFACYCGFNLKHEINEIKKIEKRICDLIVLDESLKVGMFYCENHQINICCVCSIECHKKCTIKKYSANNSDKNKRECLCDGENHTTYNEIAFTFPLDEYQKLSGVSVWPIQILNILFKQKRLENLSQLFKATIGGDEISEEQKKEFFPLLEIFSSTFNRKFKTPYYAEEILDIFEYNKLIEYIRKIELNSVVMVTLKIRLIFILLFVHLKNDFKITKNLISNDYLCYNILERIIYRKILMKDTIFNKQLNDKYSIKNLIQNDNLLKDIILNDVCNLMAIGIDYMNIEENEEDFEICLKIICFLVKKMLFTREDLIKLINSIYIFFNKFIGHANSGKRNIFLLIDLFSGLAELFLMISVAYNDLVIMEYLDKYKDISNINKIEIKTDFIHVQSDHGTKLFEMIMKSCGLIKKHYDLLNKNEDILSNKDSKLFKDKKKMEKLNNSKFVAVEIKLPSEGGLFFEKIINLFVESLSIFSLADNIYFKQIDFLTKNDLIDYYNFCERIEFDNYENMNNSEANSINGAINNLKSEIENKLQIFFTSSISNNIKNIADEFKNLFTNFSEQINEILGNKNNEEKFDKNKKENEKFKKELKKEYIKIELNEKDDSEIIGKVSTLNYFLSKIAFKKKNIFPFLLTESFEKKCKDLVDILIISNLDEIITKILVFFSNRKYPNLLTYDLLDIIYSTLSLYFFSKRGIKYLLIGKNLVRINKVFNRYNIKPNNKNINEKYGKTAENNTLFINRTLEFCCSLLKGMKLYEINLKGHKILERFRKNMLSHICLLNSEVKNDNIDIFIFQFKKIINIFYFLSKDLDMECLDQIKRQCVFIFKQNQLNIFDNKSLYNVYNNVQSSEDKLTLKSNRSGQDLANNNKSSKNTEINKSLISLYFSFFRLFGVNTFYMFINEENDLVMDILYNFTDLNLLKKYFTNNYFEIKQKLIFFKYLRSVYFIDHLDPYNILSQKYNLTTIEFNVLIKCNAIVNEKFEKCLNLKEGLSLPAKIVKDLMDKYKKINELELIVNIYLNEVKNFPRQLLNSKVGECRLYYKNLLFDIKFLSNYFYAQKNIWSKFNLIFYQLCLEFIPKVDIFKNVYEALQKDDIETIFIIDEELYENTLDEINEEDMNQGNKNINKEIKDSNKGDWDKVKLKAYKTIQKLKSISFDIYNTKELYSYLNEFIDSILYISNLSHIYDLQTYLAVYDETAEANFTPFCLLETLDYEYFYEEDKQEQDEEIKKDINLYKLKYLKDNFFEKFININNTNFMEIINKIESDNSLVDYTKEYVELFKSFITSKEGNRFRILNIFVCILAKMLFYNNERVQDKFEDFINDEYFFPYMNILLNMYLVLVFSLTKNIYAYKFLSQINNLSKLIIQLLQSLGEGFNIKYHNNIFKLQKDVPLIEKDDDDNTIEDIISSSEESEKISSNEENEINENNKNNELNNKEKIKKANLILEIPDINVPNTIYESLIINLKYALTSVGMKNLIEGELPYDKLIISITNIFDFLIEYIESNEDNDEIIKSFFKTLFFGVRCKKNQYDKNNMELLMEEKCIDLLFVKIYTDDTNKDQYSLRKKIICYIKNKFANFLVYYLLTGNKENMVDKLMSNNCTPFDLFAEIVYNFKQLLNNLEQKNPKLTEKLSKALKNSDIDTYVNLLIDYFGFEEEFRNMIEFPMIIQYYILIKIYDEFYNHKELKTHFEGLKEDMDEINNLDDYNIRSKFSLCIYLFLEKIILKVEIKVDNDESEEDTNETEQNKNKIANLVVHNINNEPFINKMKRIVKKGIENDANEEEEESNEDNQYAKENSKNIKTAFFLRPYLTFTLSETSKVKFMRDVDRTNASQKYISLINFADYCLFEMVVNRHLIRDSEFKNYLANINYFLIELINYIVIFINNCFVIYHFYKSPYLPIENYDIFDENEISKLHIDNIIISLAQIVALILVLVVYVIFEFMNDFQSCVMKLYKKRFLLKKEGEENEVSQVIIDYFQDKDNVSSYKFFNEVNKNFSKWKLIYVGFFHICLLNREINMLLLTVILNLLFLLFQNYLFLVVEILFIVNIVPTLSDILKAMQIKYLHIILVLIFDLLIIYIFMWLGFFFFQDFFVYDEILEASSGSKISEGFCYSSAQCYLYYISLGTRSGGGIGESISAVSYQKDIKIFFARFFHDMFFFVIVNLILGNVFLGIIIDTFGELRDANLENEYDRKNICFICQISNDDCLRKNIDFNKHVSEVHNVWNYVYFLAYLHLNNPNNFNRVENSVWEKLEIQDYGWIPIFTDSDKD